MTELDQKKENLSAYKNLCIKLQSLEEQLQSIREAGEAARVQVISDMPKGNKKKDLSDYMISIERIIIKIMHMKQKCMEQKLDIENQISEILDGVESSILRKRYIEFKTWEQISLEIDYSWKQTHRIHSKALMNLR